MRRPAPDRGDEGVDQPGEARPRLVRAQPERHARREVAAGGGLAVISGLLAGVVLFVMTRSLARVSGVVLPFVVSLWAASLIGALGTAIVRDRRRAPPDGRDAQPGNATPKASPGPSRNYSLSYN